jgi:hypothetical protein
LCQFVTNSARGAFLLPRGTLNLLGGKLDLLRGAFILLRGVLNLLGGKLVLLRGTLILLRGTFRGRGRTFRETR